ncbi:MAG: UBA/THIF-type binding protein [Pseudonocardiales bacterium]|nr:UBA/THIF-type binding protein [Pseudonocardiales bacterium]
MIPGSVDNEIELWTVARAPDRMCHRLGMPAHLHATSLEPAVAPPAGFGFMPSTRVLWRGPNRLQLELGRRAVVVEGLNATTVSALSRGRGSSAADDGDLFDMLHRAGFLSRLGGPESSDTQTPDRSLPRSVTAGLLAPDLAALGGRFGDHASGVLEARGHRRIAIHGGGRLPTLIAALLAASGIGHVHVADLGEVNLRDAIPGGLSAADEGGRIAVAASAAIRRAAPDTDTSAVSAKPADLTVLTTGVPVPRPLAASFAFAGQPHLVAGVWGAAAVIGPLVLPGRSSCLQCADLQRRDRDPAWPALAAQLEASRQIREPSDVCVGAIAAAVAANHCLQYLDSEYLAGERVETEASACIDGTLELALPDWRLRRRSWPAHPDCTCGAAGG